MSIRVYLPTTVALLAEQHAEGAFLVTDDAVLVDAGAEDEEAEYDALMTAASASAALVAGPEDRPADADPDDDLGWFATQEIGYVV